LRAAFKHCRYNLITSPRKMNRLSCCLLMIPPKDTARDDATSHGRVLNEQVRWVRVVGSNPKSSKVPNSMSAMRSELRHSTCDMSHTSGPQHLVQHGTNQISKNSLICADCHPQVLMRDPVASSANTMCSHSKDTVVLYGQATVVCRCLVLGVRGWSTRLVDATSIACGCV
jgi:hypothetical protein